MSRTSDQQDTPTSKAIRQQIFKIPLLPQDQVIKKFDEIDRLLYPYTLKLTQDFPRLQVYFQEVIFRIASGNTFGKNYFDKEDREDDAGNQKGKKKKPGKKLLLKKSEIRVLKASFSLLRPEQSPNQFSHTAKQAGFIRGVFEEALELFTDLTKDYPAHVSEMRLVKDSNPFRYLELEEKVHAVEDELGFFDRDELIRAIQESTKVWNQYMKLRDQVISPYFRLIYTIAKSTSTSELQTLDNFQYGVFGLMRAMKCYTPSRFAAFSVVATMWIRQSILLNLKNDINFIKLPMAAWNLYQKLEKVRLDLEQQTQKEPTVEQIAKAAKMSPEKVEKAYENAKLTQVYSLNQPTQYESEQSSDARWNLESIPNPEEENERLEIHSEYQLIEKVVEQFDDEEKLIFGLVSGCVELLPQSDFDREQVEREKIRQQAARRGLGLVFR